VKSVDEFKRVNRPCVWKRLKEPRVPAGDNEIYKSIVAFDKQKKKGEKEGTQGTPEEIQGANLCEYTLEKHTNSAAQVLISIDNRANLFSVLL